MRFAKFIAAVALVASSTTSQAAVYHLKDVILGSMWSMSPDTPGEPPVDHGSYPLVELSGFIEYGGPLSSNRTLLTNYEIDWRWLGTDKATVLFKSGQYDGFPGCDPSTCPRYEQSAATSSKFFFGNPRTYLDLEFAVGAGAQIDKGIVPLTVAKPSYLVYDQHASHFYDDGTHETNPALSGWFLIDDKAPHKTKLAAALAPVPEPQTWAMMGIGLALVGLSALRRRAR
jgi:hypothetical protein